MGSYLDNSINFYYFFDPSKEKSSDISTFNDLIHF